MSIIIHSWKNLEFPIQLEPTNSEGNVSRYLIDIQLFRAIFFSRNMCKCLIYLTLKYFRNDEHLTWNTYLSYGRKKKIFTISSIVCNEANDVFSQREYFFSIKIKFLTLMHTINISWKNMPRCHISIRYDLFILHLNNNIVTHLSFINKYFKK